MATSRTQIFITARKRNVVQKQTTVIAYFKSKQFLLFVFAEQSPEYVGRVSRKQRDVDHVDSRLFYCWVILACCGPTLKENWLTLRITLAAHGR